MREEERRGHGKEGSKRTAREEARERRAWEKKRKKGRVRARE